MSAIIGGGTPLEVQQGAWLFGTGRPFFIIDSSRGKATNRPGIEFGKITTRSGQRGKFSLG